MRIRTTRWASAASLQKISADFHSNSHQFDLHTQLPRYWSHVVRITRKQEIKPSGQESLPFQSTQARTNKSRVNPLNSSQSNLRPHAFVCRWREATHKQFHEEFSEKTSRFKKFRVLARQMSRCTFSLNFWLIIFLVFLTLCAIRCVSYPSFPSSRESVHAPNLCMVPRLGTYRKLKSNAQERLTSVDRHNRSPAGDYQFGRSPRGEKCLQRDLSTRSASHQVKFYFRS